MLKTCKGRAEELPWVLWADRTMPKLLTGQTPYSLVHGTEAVFLTEIMMPTTRYGPLTDETNEQALSHDVDTIDEMREAEKMRMTAYQRKVANSYNRNVHIRTFRVGDMVLRKVFQKTLDMTAGKFADNWEGPYLIDAVVGRGAYQLSTLDGTQIPRSWNALHLKLYHM